MNAEGKGQPERATGAVPAIPRRGGAVRKVFAGFFGVLALLALAAYVARTVISDQHEPLQVIAWPPAWMFLGPATALGAVARLFAVRTSGRLQGLTSLAAAAPLAVLLLGPWRVTNALTRGQEPNSVVVMSWNAAPASHGMLEPLGELIPALVAEHQPDVLIVTNPGWLRMRELLPEMTGMGLIRVGGSDIATDFPAVRRGPVPMPDTEGPGSPRMEYVVLDTSGRAGGPGTLTIWSIDLPSDRSLWRDELGRKIADAIEEVRSRGWELETPPAPDMIIGDFNIPRGSASLRHFTQGLTNAHTEAGLGPSPTYPRQTPVLHIDQAFVGGGWRATKYDIVDPGIGRHRAQRVVISPNPGAVRPTN